MIATVNYRLWIASIALLGALLLSIDGNTHAQTPAAAPVPVQPRAAQPTSFDPGRAFALVQQAKQAIAERNLPVAASAFREAAGMLPMLPQLRPELDALYHQLQAMGVQAKDLMATIPQQATGQPGLQLQSPSQSLPGGFSMPPLAAGSNLAAPIDFGRLPATMGQPTNNPSDQQNTSITKQSPVEQRLVEAGRLVAMGLAAMDRGDFQTAQQYATQADGLEVPDAAFRPGQTRPWQLMLDADAMSRRQPQMAQGSPVGGAPSSGVVQAGAVMPAGTMSGAGQVQQSGYNPNADASRVMQVQANLPQVPVPGDSSDPNEIYRKGVEALSAGNSDQARALFLEAWKNEASLDPAVRQQLKDKLTLMRPTGQTLPSPESAGAFDAVTQEQTLARARLMREVTSEIANVEQDKKDNPIGALERLQRLRRTVESNTDADSASRQQMLSMVDRQISTQQKYVEQNRAQIDLDMTNARIRAEINQDQFDLIELDEKVSQLVEQFNDLMDDQRYPEAEIIAKQVNELKPDSPIATLLWHNARMGIRLNQAEEIQGKKEIGFIDTLQAVDESSIPFDDRNPLKFADAREWAPMSTTRLQRERAANRRMGPREQEIESRLTTPVEVRFDNRPLGEVIDTLSKMTGVPMHIDDRALSAFNMTRDQTVSIDLSQPISLRSALQLILSPLDLSYVIRNEVLMVTSREMQRSDVYPVTYRVASLVLPIPNFTTSYETGLAGAIQAAHAMSNNRLNVNTMPVSLTGLAANNTPMSPTSMNPNILAQGGFTAPGAFGFGGNGGHQGQTTQPGSMGGGAIADFDSLMELIQTTVVPDTWEALGGPSTMSPYPANLSLVVSTTSEVHDQITQLLESLRRLQNLQVTIEVRFISLADNFFERIGLSFNVEFDDNVSTLPLDDRGPSVAIGLGDAAGTPTADFDIAFNQGSFGASVPAFGGFDAGSAASIGFAILSDIEAFFFLEAAQGDSRTNVLQAPKVTLFDGQIASINDQSQRPFVISVTPIVGDFAVAQQPIIVVLNEGTALNVQAVVSDDRRFVRLTLVPFFSQIGEVDTFTFEGRSTTNNSTRRDTNGDGVIDENDEDVSEEEVNEGTTVQLPTFAFTSVSTTVSVPDGGTILLGGIKRLRETRSEQGVPILSKIPYINRLFKNVGTGRETNSLMLMVTPRIIIQEEEELAQTGFDPTR